MARSQMLAPVQDLQQDSGSVLWSLIQGEQLEFAVTLNFIENVGVGYTYEAVIIEGNNVEGNNDVPTSARPGGISSQLAVRVPTDRGNWDAATGYNREDVVFYGTSYYKLSQGADRISATLPNADPLWELYTPNKVFIQFPETLSLKKTFAATAIPGTPGAIGAIKHGLSIGNPVKLFANATPGGITVNNTYYVVSSGFSEDAFRVSGTPNGTPIDISSIGSGLTVELAAWTVQPTLISAIHGFFELRVTEPAGGVFQRTWKPMRGLVSLQYSPTQLV